MSQCYDLPELPTRAEIEAIGRALEKADDIAAEVACMSDVSTEGRKARRLGNRLHRILANATTDLLALIETQRKETR